MKIAASIVTLCALLSGTVNAEEPHVTVNRKPLTSAEHEELARLGVQIPAGDYWYDRATGAWGMWGGPTAGWIAPQLHLGGPLTADASGGGTHVFINGRELHPVDVAGLRQLIPLRPGRYWADAAGNLGFEGRPALVNVVRVMQQLAAAQAASGGGGYGYNRGGATFSGSSGGFRYQNHNGSVGYTPSTGVMGTSKVGGKWVTYTGGN